VSITGNDTLSASRPRRHWERPNGALDYHPAPGRRVGEDTVGLDSVELIMEIEDEFKLRIPDDDAVELRTAGGILDYVAARIDLAPEAVERRVWKSISRRLNVPVADIRRESRIAEDLGAD
jgi:acyl carrier protein